VNTERLIGRKEGAVGWLVFNNPERRNAVSLDMWQAMPRLLDDFAADAAIRCVVLTGAGDKAFVSGADISQFEKERSSAEAVARYDEIGERAQTRLAGFDKPTIAMIRGYCLGGGLNIANLCDLRIAADDARFGTPEVDLGLFPYMALAPLCRVIGRRAALECTAGEEHALRMLAPGWRSA